jgi:hypothetical protein
MVAARRGEGEQGAWGAGYPAESRAGRGQHEPAYPPGRLTGQLLGDDPAERHAEHVHPVVPEGVEHRLDRPGDAAHPAG